MGQKYSATRTFKLGDWYKIGKSKVCQFIKVTDRGYNFIYRNECIFRRHLYMLNGSMVKDGEAEVHLDPDIRISLAKQPEVQGLRDQVAHLQECLKNEDTANRGLQAQLEELEDGIKERTINDSHLLLRSQLGYSGPELHSEEAGHHHHDIGEGGSNDSKE